jgi:hypothetical protein
MGEIADYWRDVKQSVKANRARRVAAAVAALQAAGVGFRELLGGHHLRLKLPDGRTVDYWPGTQKLLNGGTKPQPATLNDVLRLLEVSDV